MAYIEQTCVIKAKVKVDELPFWILALLTGLYRTQYYYMSEHHNYARL